MPDPAPPESETASPPAIVPADAGASKSRRVPTRLPIPPLLEDLAGWGWRLLLLGVVAWALLRVAETLYLVSLSLAGSLLFTALLSPMVMRLRRRRVPRVLATAVVVIAALLVFGGILFWVFDRAVTEFPTLVNQVGDAVGRLPFRSSTIDTLRDDLVREIETHRGALSQGVISGVQTGAEVVTGLLLTFLLTLILLADGDRIWGWLVGRFPASAQPRVSRAGHHAYARLSGWIRGTFVIAVFHGCVVAAVLFLMGVPLVAPLAILVFFGSFIPIVGALIFGGIAVLVTFATHGLTDAIVLTVVLVIDNQIEAHILQPFLVGRYVQLHPFVVALTITAGAMLVGLWGALLAVPFTAAVYAALTHLEPRPPARRLRRLGDRSGAGHAG
jgi:predicted PurR-regulated permease PerM